MKARWWAEGAGLALLIFLPYFFGLLVPGNLPLYHHELPLTNLTFGVLLDLAILAALCTLALIAVQHLPVPLRRWAGPVLAAGVLWRAALVAAIVPASGQSNLDVHGKGTSPRLAHFVQIGMSWNHSLAAALVLLFLLLAMSKPSAMRTIVQATRIGLAGFAFSALWLVPQLIYLGTRRPPPTITAAEVRQLPAAANTPQQRVVWILLDELSYRLAFEQPPAGQNFPNLNRLRDRSFSFDNIDPVGFYTDRIIPSLLAGKEIDQIRGTSTGELEILTPGQHQWQDYDPGSGLFALAQEQGWNPGVAGWYNPYCRIFRSVVSDCSWRPGIHVDIPLETAGASADLSVTANALVLPKRTLARAFGRPANDSRQARERDIDDYRSLMTRARDLIQNSQVRFAFVHLPVPHPPGIYDRRTHQLRPAGNYLDNLTLADDTLDELMQQIGATADADRTIVIVSSDHSWRVPMWRAGADWTPEEEQISQGQFDPRPVFLVHFPGQTNRVDVAAALPELREHDIIAAILSRQIGDEVQMAALLSAENHTVAHQDQNQSGAGQ